MIRVLHHFRTGLLLPCLVILFVTGDSIFYYLTGSRGGEDSLHNGGIICNITPTPIRSFNVFQARALANVIASSTQPIQNLRVLQYVASRETPLDKVQWAKKWITDGLTGESQVIAVPLPEGNALPVRQLTE